MGLCTLVGTVKLLLVWDVLPRFKQWGWIAFNPYCQIVINLYSDFGGISMLEEDEIQLWDRQRQQHQPSHISKQPKFPRSTLRKGRAPVLLHLKALKHNPIEERAYLRPLSPLPTPAHVSIPHLRTTPAASQGLRRAVLQPQEFVYPKSSGDFRKL